MEIYGSTIKIKTVLSNKKKKVYVRKQTTICGGVQHKIKGGQKTSNVWWGVGRKKSLSEKNKVDSPQN